MLGVDVHRGPDEVRPGVLRGVRRVDAVLAAAAVVLAVTMGVLDVGSVDAGVRVDTHSPLMVPVFVLAALPVLWWRRAPVAVVAVAVVVMTVHDLWFGHVVRCGFGLPLAFLLAFLVGSSCAGAAAAVGLGLSVLLTAAVLVWDTAAGPDLLPVVAVLVLVLWGIGRIARSRSALVARLRGRNAELAALRERTAELEVDGDRLRVSRRLEAVIDARLGDLEATAGAARDGDDPDRTRAALAALEDGGRRTLDDMREVVHVLRGTEDRPPAPTPSLAELAGLLERRGLLTVEGDPRVLPTGLELSVHRIVEYLVDALDGRRALTLRYEPEAVEIDVAGTPVRPADLRGALARVRERARLHAGSVDADIGRRRARVRVRVPVPGG